MKCFVVVSSCLYVNDLEDHAIFHFKGVYCGERVKSIKVEYVGNCPFQLNKDYILYLGFAGISAGELRGKLIKSRELCEINCVI